MPGSEMGQPVAYSDAFYQAIDRLGIPLTLIAPGAPPRPEQPTRLHDTSTSHIGRPEIKRFRETIHDFSVLDDEIGGDQLWQIALLQLQLVEDASTNCTIDCQIQDQLQRVIGDLKRSTGWFSFDSGKQAEARYYLNEALHISLANNDHFLMARIVANMTWQDIELRRWRPIVQLAQYAATNVGKFVTPRVRALLDIREAQGWALRGEETLCNAAIDRARDEFAAGTSDRDPEWVPSYVSEAQLAREEGICRSALGEYAQAGKMFKQAAAGFHTRGYRRNLGVCLIHSSINALYLGELDEAAFHTQQVAALAGQLRSTRVTSELRRLRHRLTPFQKVPAIRDALEQLDTHALA